MWKLGLLGIWTLSCLQMATHFLDPKNPTYAIEFLTPGCSLQGPFLGSCYGVWGFLQLAWWPGAGTKIGGKLKPKGPFLESLEMAIHPSTNPSLGWGTHVRFQGVFLLLTPCRLSLLRIDDGCRLWYFYIYKLDTECQSMTSSKYSKLFIGSDNPPGIVVTYPKWPLLCWVKSYSSNVEYK